MTETAQPAAPPFRRAIEAPFTRRAWAEIGHTLASLPLAAAALAVIVPTLVNGPLWALSTDIVRKLGAAARFLARELLREDIPAPRPIEPVYRVKVATPDAVSLFELGAALLK